jgi:multidrug efflux pump subunit AcrB
MRAALDGAADIGFTILSMSISLVAVFIPLLLSELVTLHQTVTPLSVNHQGQFPSVTLSFNLRANEWRQPSRAMLRLSKARYPARRYSSSRH